jgi:hypothetical protein
VGPRHLRGRDHHRRVSDLRLPHPISAAEDAAAQNTSLREINTDVHACAYAVGDAFRFYAMFQAGELSPAHLIVAKKLVREDRDACGYTGAGIVQLTTNLQVLDTAAGKNVDKLMFNTVRWMDPDALAAIEDILVLFEHPHDVTTLSDLGRQQAHLAEHRDRAFADLARASALLHTSLIALKLPALPHLAGT